MSDWVIVVDDNEINLKMAGHILSKANMRVTAIKSGAKLLEYISENEAPDLILLDIKMPEMDGFETIKELRKIDKSKETPVIFLTADEFEGTEIKGLSLGAMDFIKKPF
nr:response regulator [Lachnospiraceae bacterium]